MDTQNALKQSAQHLFHNFERMNYASTMWDLEKMGMFLKDELFVTGSDYTHSELSKTIQELEDMEDRGDEGDGEAEHFEFK